jgi:hypothetical protein
MRKSRSVVLRKSALIVGCQSYLGKLLLETTSQADGRARALRLLRRGSLRNVRHPVAHGDREFREVPSADDAIDDVECLAFVRFVMW